VSKVYDRHVQNCDMRIYAAVAHIRMDWVLSVE